MIRRCVALILMVAHHDAGARGAPESAVQEMQIASFVESTLCSCALRVIFPLGAYFYFDAGNYIYYCFLVYFSSREECWIKMIINLYLHNQIVTQMSAEN
jgi:uncharacterized membrane protein YesL